MYGVTTPDWSAPASVLANGHPTMDWPGKAVRGEYHVNKQKANKQQASRDGDTESTVAWANMFAPGRPTSKAALLSDFCCFRLSSFIVWSISLLLAPATGFPSLYRHHLTSSAASTAPRSMAPAPRTINQDKSVPTYPTALPHSHPPANTPRCPAQKRFPDGREYPHRRPTKPSDFNATRPSRPRGTHCTAGSTDRMTGNLCSSLCPPRSTPIGHELRGLALHPMQQTW